MILYNNSSDSSDSSESSNSSDSSDSKGSNASSDNNDYFDEFSVRIFLKTITQFDEVKNYDKKWTENFCDDIFWGLYFF